MPSSWRNIVPLDPLPSSVVEMSHTGGEESQEIRKNLVKMERGSHYNLQSYGFSLWPQSQPETHLHG